MTNRIVHIATKASLLLLALLFFASCIYDDDNEDCRIRIHFDYSHNMSSTNLFGEQVDKVTVYIFDENGIFLQEVTEQGSHITNDYVMMVPLFNNKYQFVAIAQSTTLTGEKANFTFPKMTPKQSKLTDLQAAIQKANNRFDGQLNNLLIAYQPTIHLDYKEVRSIVMATKKVNNTVRIEIDESCRPEITTDTYTIRIEEAKGNGVINYDYQIKPDGALTYFPYLYEGNTNGKTVTADFSLSRLLETHGTRLIIEDNVTGQTIIDQDLYYYIRMIHEENAKQWSFQEFLDREDEYLIRFGICGDTSTWLSVTIIINDWVLNLVNIEL